MAQIPSDSFLLRGGRVVTPHRVLQTDEAVVDGQIGARRADLSEPACERVGATRQWVFPGVIDAHVHFNEPGRADWQGLATGSRALAAGGGTWFFDMPLNSEPPVANRSEERRV